MTTTTTILAAGGPIGNELSKILAASNQTFRLVSRKPMPGRWDLNAYSVGAT